MKILIYVLAGLFLFFAGVMLGIKMAKTFEETEEEDNETDI